MPCTKPLILVVEDDEAILLALAELLEQEGFRVQVANEGQEALNQLRTREELPGLILLDLMMPKLDGIGFREKQELDPRISKIPTVLMSADHQIESKKKKLGLQHHVKKPIDLDRFLDTVRRLV